MKPNATDASRRKKPNTANPRQNVPASGKNVLMRIAVVCLLLSLLVSSGIFTWAKFTNSLQAQRTVAAYDPLGDLFSSNYLQAGDGANARTVMVATDQDTPEAVVTVCNYEQGWQTRVNSNDITYNLSLQLVKYDAENGYVEVENDEEVNAGYSITVERGDSSVTLGRGRLSDNSTFASQTLAKGAPRSNAYTVTFAPYQNTIFLKMTVTSTSPSMVPLHGILKAGIRMAGASSAWSGSFQDPTGSPPSAFDGFNYQITGVGSGTFTLRWDASKVDLISTPEVLALLAVATRVGNSITFPVNAETVNLYELQFTPVNITNETWVDMASSVVTYDFTES